MSERGYDDRTNSRSYSGYSIGNTNSSASIDGAINHFYDYYAFTLKARARKRCDVDHYRVRLGIWRDLYGARIVHNSYEHDKLGRLHCHGVVCLPHGHKYKDLCSKLFATKFVRLWNNRDLQNWMLYCDKDQDQLCVTPKEGQTPIIKKSLFRVNLCKDCINLISRQ